MNEKIESVPAVITPPIFPKIPCGGFYVGGGLEIDPKSKTISTQYGKEIYNEGLDVTWDGVGGINVEGGLFYRVSDALPVDADLSRLTVLIVSGEETGRSVFDSIRDSSIGQLICVYVDAIEEEVTAAVNVIQDVQEEGYTLKSGLYLVSMYDYYTSRFTIPGEYDIVKIPEKFLPDTNAFPILINPEIVTTSAIVIQTDGTKKIEFNIAVGDTCIWYNCTNKFIDVAFNVICPHGIYEVYNQGRGARYNAIYNGGFELALKQESGFNLGQVIGFDHNGLDFSGQSGVPTSIIGIIENEPKVVGTAGQYGIVYSRFKDMLYSRLVTLPIYDGVTLPYSDNITSDDVNKTLDIIGVFVGNTIRVAKSNSDTPSNIQPIKFICNRIDAVNNTVSGYFI